MAISESIKIEELAGFTEIAETSPPKAPNAPPIALNLEVPSWENELYLKTSSYDWEKENVEVNMNM